MRGSGSKHGSAETYDQSPKGQRVGSASTTFQLILAVLGFYYAVDRMLVLPPGTLILHKGLGRYAVYWSAQQGVRLWNGQFLAWGGLLPWTLACPCEIPPFDADRSEVSLGRAYLPSHHPPPEPTKPISYDGLQPTRDDSKLMCGGQSVRCASRASARIYTERLLALVPAKKRAAALESMVVEQTQREAIEIRMKDLLRATRSVRALATLAFLALFVGGPWLTVHGAPWPWWYVAIAYVLLLTALQTAYVTAHRRLYPAQGRQRWLYALSMLLSPAQAIAAPAALAREALAPFVPEAVAVSLLPTPSSTRVLQALWRGMAHTPSPPAYRERFEAWLEAEEIDATSVRAAPEHEAGCTYYCPRCHDQYTSRTNMCPSCPGVVPIRY